MNVATIKAAVVSDPLNGCLRKYHNRNWLPAGQKGAGAGKWLFGARTDKYSATGFQFLWTDDEALALADNGEIARMLGLGSNAITSASMVNSNGGGGSSATLFDAIFEQIKGGDHASQLMVKISNRRKGGVYDVHRADGTTLELKSIW